jgi:hypothetical protein
MARVPQTEGDPALCSRTATAATGPFDAKVSRLCSLRAPVWCGRNPNSLTTTDMCCMHIFCCYARKASTATSLLQQKSTTPPPAQLPLMLCMHGFCSSPPQHQLLQQQQPTTPPASASSTTSSLLQQHPTTVAEQHPSHPSTSLLQHQFVKQHLKQFIPPQSHLRGVARAACLSCWHPHSAPGQAAGAATAARCCRCCRLLPGHRAPCACLPPPAAAGTAA